jgi:hypothetical protein
MNAIMMKYHTNTIKIHPTARKFCQYNEICFNIIKQYNAHFMKSAMIKETPPPHARLGISEIMDDV